MRPIDNSKSSTNQHYFYHMQFCRCGFPCGNAAAFSFHLQILTEICSVLVRFRRTRRSCSRNGFSCWKNLLHNPRQKSTDWDTDYNGGIRDADFKSVLTKSAPYELGHGFPLKATVPEFT